MILVVALECNVEYFDQWETNCLCSGLSGIYFYYRGLVLFAVFILNQQHSSVVEVPISVSHKDTFLSFPFLSFPFLSFPFLSSPLLSSPLLSSPFYPFVDS